MAAEDESGSQQWKRLLVAKRPTVKGVRRRARKIEGVTVRHAHRFILSRLTNLNDVRRHAVGWMALASLLVVVTLLQLFWVKDAYVASYQADGGIYAEGVIGRIDTLNPIYASTQSERSASQLLFSSLLRYDGQNNLANDLASGYKLSSDGKRYDVTLRQDALWHDGKPVTADDVVYTLALIKNPATRSFLYRTWQDVSVKKLGKYEVEFQLPSPYAPFPHALTFGIVPKHILGSTSPVRIRESSFSRNPVGSGPFVFQALRPIDPAASRAVLQLTKNADYYRGGMRLDRFQLQTYKSHDELRQGFLSREINAAVELSTTDIDTITQEAPTTVVADARMNNGVYAFFRTDNPVLSDASVRHALVLATDRKAIIKSLKGLAGDLQGPLVEDQIKSVAGIKQDVFNLDKAAELLDKAGWVKKGAVRVKAEQKLQLTIVAPKSGDFPQVTEMVSSEWRKLGVDVRTQLVDTATFEQNIVKPRAYDVLLYELALGADPDVFAYWHSSQATVKGYNLSNYKSGVADDALVSARSRSETALRAAKYAAFFRQWLNDAPAVALYRPHLHYVTTDSTTSVKSSDTVVDALGRYNMLDQWTVRLEDQFKTP